MPPSARTASGRALSRQMSDAVQTLCRRMPDTGGTARKIRPTLLQAAAGWGT
jgi:hypothetical protein